MALNTELIPGYPRLAHEMGSMPEIAVFRRFSDLNCQRRLYLDKAVLRHVRMASLPNPNRCDLSYLRKWLQKCIDENPRQALDGLDCEVWNGDSPAQNSGTGDLFVMRARPKEDPFSTWIVEKVICGLYQTIWRRCRHTNPDGLTINDAHILRSTSFLTTAVASLLPVG